MRHFLEQCLYSLQEAIREIEAEVWVVDNASTDDSLPYLKPLFPWIKWIESTENLGFSKANNLALQSASGEYVLFLNPDTLMPEDCLLRCIAFMQQQKQARALGIRMVDGAGRFLPESKRGYPGPLTSFFRLSGLSSLFPHSRVFARYYLGHLPPLSNHPVEVLAGAFMLVRKTVLDITGGFDERYFMYGEDIDLSYSINNLPGTPAGSSPATWYFAGSMLLHFKGESTSKASLGYVKNFYRAMLLFVKKHYPPWRALIFGLLIYAAMALRALAGLVVYQRKAAPAAGPVWVAGAEEDYEEVKQMLAYPGMRHEVAGRLAPAGESATGHKLLQAWVKSAEAGRGGTLIFCVSPQLPMKEVLQLLEQQPAVRCMFHYRGSKSIVGSSQSNRTGEIIAP